MPVTFLTDFGTRDFYIGAMKGAVLAVCPDAALVDLTHDIAPQDVADAAFTLKFAVETFPAETIHIAVVDPGVGSARNILLARIRSQMFVAPDNGLLSYVLENAPDARLWRITNKKYFRATVSSTFHGRDIFAPVAGALANGVKPEALGEPIKDYVKLPSFAPEQLSPTQWRGRVLHIDRFGNLATNFSEAHLSLETAREQNAELRLAEQRITRFVSHFAAAQQSAPCALMGSAGLWEIVARNASAAQLLAAERDNPLTLTLNQPTH